jgi:hypothetical protein
MALPKGDVSAVESFFGMLRLEFFDERRACFMTQEAEFVILRLAVAIARAGSYKVFEVCTSAENLTEFIAFQILRPKFFKSVSEPFRITGPPRVVGKMTGKVDVQIFTPSHHPPYFDLRLYCKMLAGKSRESVFQGFKVGREVLSRKLCGTKQQEKRKQ